jgi:hypothetical protein
MEDRYEAILADMEWLAAQVDAEGKDLKAIHHVQAICLSARAGTAAGRAAGMRAIIPPRDDWSTAPPGYYD